MSRFRHAAAGIAERFLAARYYQAMSQMNDRQLADMGLTRATIGERAMELARSH